MHFKDDMACMQALRSNGRIAIQSPEFASQLWAATGLDQLMQELPCGTNAQGLNPNIRIYRCAVLTLQLACNLEEVLLTNATCAEASRQDSMH